MDFCVLGLLLIQEMTIYQLNKAFKASLSLFYSASLGSLQKATKKLLDEGKIGRREVQEGKRQKKIYYILPRGRDAFHDMMKSELPSSRLEETALARLSFLGLLETPEEKEEVLEVIVRSVTSALNGLTDMKRELNKQELPESLQEVYFWQMKTLDYGIMAHRAGLGWFQTLLEDYRAGQL